MKRRDFVRNISIAGAGVSFFNPAQLFAHQAAPKVRLGFIGVGLRGQSHLHNALNRSDVDVVAMCDIDDHMLEMAKNVVTKSGKPMPKIFTGDPHAYRKLLEEKDLHGIIIATPWEWHAPMILDALAAGIKYVGTEVILGITLQDHWDVVKAAEQHNAQVMMLENVCFRRDVMAILQMVRQGVFGELIHMQGGYQHDLRGIKFNNGKDGGVGVEFGDKGFSEAKWRTNHSIHRNGDLYPTHGVGPIAEMLNINYGNRFVSLNSVATKARGLHNYIVDHAGENHPNAKIEFKLGDVVTTQLKTANGETVLLQHDTCLPRPYSLGFRVQGTRGLWMDVSNTLYIEGMSAKPDQWDDAKTWLDKYDHPLWKKYANDAEGAGHGGMDFFVLQAFIEAIQQQTPTIMDVYDAAAWSAITPLSEMSIQLNQTVEFPDFTSGQWMYRQNKFS
ncbi:MAG TPA: Gfo/Idh/MocA family oxidoreductase [Puia sp.]|nr:Gfo/Idh/MocA family oxidoreductase [Puia sp.]